MKDFSNIKNSVFANKQEIESPREEKLNYSLLKKIETIEPFFVRRVPVWKRTLDIIGSFCGMVLFSPLFLVIAILIKIVSPGPVFFKQTRIGYGGREFKMWKFRTMKVDADCSIHQKHVCELYRNDQVLNKLERDPRIILFGNFLRRASIDEFPQLFNVFKGDMSLIGPRPDVPYAVKEYKIWHQERFDVLPGMTGLWQVSGKNRISLREMMSLDIRYSHKRSIFNDIKIIILTFPAVINELRDGKFGISALAKKVKKLFIVKAAKSTSKKD